MLFMESTKDLIHQIVESTDDSTTLMFYLYVANQLLTDQPDYNFLNSADLNQLLRISTLVDRAALNSSITSSIIDEKIRVANPY